MKFKILMLKMTKKMIQIRKRKSRLTKTRKIKKKNYWKFRLKSVAKALVSPVSSPYSATRLTGQQYAQAKAVVVSRASQVGPDRVHAQLADPYHDPHDPRHRDRVAM